MNDFPQNLYNHRFEEAMGELRKISDKLERMPDLRTSLAIAATTYALVIASIIVIMAYA